MHTMDDSLQLDYDYMLGVVPTRPIIALSRPILVTWCRIFLATIVLQRNLQVASSFIAILTRLRQTLGFGCGSGRSA